MAAVASAIMLGFLFYNLVDFPPGIREIMVAHDAGAALGCAGVWWWIRTGRLRVEHAHATGTAMLLLLASNILLAMWLLRDPFYAIYICVLLVGAGAGMTSVAWGGVGIAALWLGSVPVLGAVSKPPEMMRYLAMMAATSAVTMALIVIRVRYLRTLCEVLSELDARVLQRTQELQQANVALRAEMDERARAEHEARLLGEQLLHAQRLESLGRLAGGVAHDFNNVLTVIQGNLHVALEELPPGADREPIEDAISASERAVTLTRQLLAFGRKQVIERTVLDLGKHVDDVTRILQRILGERIELHVTAAEHDLWVNADPNQLEQVLLNLATNARDAMPDGGRCDIEVGRVQVGERPFVQLRFRDTGTGMDATTRERLFEPFFTTKRPDQGTGLGLAMAYGVIQQHGGTITVDSSPGTGTMFEIRLPAAEDGARAARDRTAAPPQTGGTELVLLVEDEAAVRRVAERFLRRQGYEVLVAAGGAEALEIVARIGRPIDLLFTDVMMPGMNGRELAERLRAVYPGLRVLFVSGYTGDYLQTQTGELPAGTHLLYKPYEPNHAARLIREILDGRGGGGA